MRMNHLLVLPFAMLFLLISQVAAAEQCISYSNEYCINNTHRYWEKNICFNNTLYSFNETEYCSYNCGGGQCLPSKGSDTLSLAIMFCVISFSFIYLGLNLSKENSLLSWVFIPIGILFMAVGLFFVAAQSIFSSQINESLAGIMYSIIVVIIFMIAYFFIYIIFNTFQKARPYSDIKIKYS